MTAPPPPTFPLSQGLDPALKAATCLLPQGWPPNGGSTVLTNGTKEGESLTLHVILDALGHFWLSRSPFPMLRCMKNTRFIWFIALWM